MEIMTFIRPDDQIILKSKGTKFRIHNKINKEYRLNQEG